MGDWVTTPTHKIKRKTPKIYFTQLILARKYWYTTPTEEKIRGQHLENFWHLPHIIATQTSSIFFLNIGFFLVTFHDTYKKVLSKVRPISVTKFSIESLTINTHSYSHITVCYIAWVFTFNWRQFGIFLNDYDGTMSGDVVSYTYVNPWNCWVMHWRIMNSLNLLNSKLMIMSKYIITTRT